MKKILGIGSALVDILIRLDDEHPLSVLDLPKGSMQLVDKERSENVLNHFRTHHRSLAAGGSAANTVHGIGKLGGHAGFLGVIGRDELGGHFSEDMKDAGVELHLMTSDTATGRTITLITPDSERTFATWLGAASELSSFPLRKEVFSAYDLLHMEGYLVYDHEMVERLLHMAREAGMMISLDLASYNVVEANRDFLHHVVKKYIDIVFANEEEGRAFSGGDPREALEALGDMTSVAIVKTGSKGSMVSSSGQVTEVHAIPADVIDTTGAGDLYASGFLYGFMNDLPLAECGRLGSILGGSVIEVIGAKPDPGRWNSIRNQVFR